VKHELKIKPEYFAAIYFGEKTFEIRNNADRNFQVGDTLLLKAWDGEFNGDFVEKVVSYITDFEQKPGYVVLGLVNHREHELLEKFHRTGVAIERAISTGSVLADHPLKSRLDLLANHHEREIELASQLSDATRQCGVMAELLREVTQIVPAIGVAIDDLPVVDAFLERIEAALAGKLPEPSMPEGWQLVEKANCFTLVSDGQVIASIAGPDAEAAAALLATVLKREGEA
jgi:ASC-1-like (ASCH) protein